MFWWRTDASSAASLPGARRTTTTRPETGRRSPRRTSPTWAARASSTSITGTTTSSAPPIWWMPATRRPCRDSTSTAARWSPTATATALRRDIGAFELQPAPPSTAPVRRDGHIRYRTVGTLRRTGTSGANSIRFQRPDRQASAAGRPLPRRHPRHRHGGQPLCGEDGPPPDHARLTSRRRPRTNSPNGSTARRTEPPRGLGEAAATRIGVPSARAAKEKSSPIPACVSAVKRGRGIPTDPSATEQDRGDEGHGGPPRVSPEAQVDRRSRRCEPDRCDRELGVPLPRVFISRPRVTGLEQADVTALVALHSPAQQRTPGRPRTQRRGPPR